MSSTSRRFSRSVAVHAAALAVALRCSDVAAQCDAWQPLGSGMNNIVYSIGEYNTELIVGGQFIFAGGQLAPCIARWNGSTWQPVGSGLNARVLALALYNGELIAGGEFTMSGGQSVSRIARWDGTAWQPLGAGMNAAVTTLAIFNGDLVAGGVFTTADGLTVNHIARWDGSAWEPLGSGFTNSVTALLPFNGALIAGGQFFGGGINFIAQWDGASWQPLGNGTNGAVHDLAIFNNDLIACGEFTVAGALGLPDGLLVNRVAGWNGSGWRQFDLGLNFPVHDVTIYGGALTVGGSFTASGSGQSALRMARWNGAAWQPMGSGMDGGVYAIGVWDGKLIAGGEFFNAGGQSANAIAQWGNCPTAVGDASPGSMSGIEFRGAYEPGSGGAFGFTLPEGATARLEVFDVTGRFVTQWNGSAHAAGRHHLPLSEIAGPALSEGVYFGRLDVTVGPEARVYAARTVHVR